MRPYRTVQCSVVLYLRGGERGVNPAAATTALCSRQVDTRCHTAALCRCVAHRASCTSYRALAPPTEPTSANLVTRPSRCCHHEPAVSCEYCGEPPWCIPARQGWCARHDVRVKARLGRLQPEVTACRQRRVKGTVPPAFGLMLRTRHPRRTAARRMSFDIDRRCCAQVAARWQWSVKRGLVLWARQGWGMLVATRTTLFAVNVRKQQRGALSRSYKCSRRLATGTS